MRPERPCRPRGGTDVDGQLARALVASARAAGVDCTVIGHRSHPWASATFTGSRHDLTLAVVPSPAAEAWTGALAEAELALRGHVVASVAVERRDGALALVVLTIGTG